jgi:hypothetical protein
MAYTAGFSVSVGDPTKASDVTTLAANDDFLKTAIDKIMVDSATPTFALVNGVTATTQSSGNNSTKLATTAYADAATISFANDANNRVVTGTGSGLNGEADLTFASNKLIVFGTTGTGAATASVLNLSTRETTVVDADQLGRIEFQAPAESEGSDAVLVAASIYAEADVTFDATNNATDLVLATAHDGAAAERVRITSQGEIGLAGANYGTDGQVLTSAGPNAAVAWETIPPGTTLSGSTAHTVATVTGANALEGEANLTFDGSVLAVTGTADVSGDFTAGKVNADGDTSAGDNAAMGYTAAEGLILTGQGSTNDVTIKNDADAEVLSVPTGTQQAIIGRGLSGVAASAIAADLVVEGSGNTGISILCDGTTNASSVFFGDAAAADIGRILYQHSSNSMDFYTSSSLAMRITSAGNVGIGVTPLHRLEILTPTSNGYISTHTNSHGSTPAGVLIDFSGASPDNYTQFFLRCDDSTTQRLYIYSDGDVANHDGAYGTISDVKLKQDISDVRSYWDDFKSLQYRKFRHKTDVELDADAPYRLGLIAQEVETVFPALVPESPDADIETEEAVVDKDGVAVLDEDDNPTYETISTPSGTTHKWVKSSIIEGPIMGSVVQELMTRLEAAEAKITALESA